MDDAALGPLDGEAVGKLMFASGLIDEDQLREALIRLAKRRRAAAIRTLTTRATESTEVKG